MTTETEGRNLSPTHPRTGEPETEAGRGFVEWIYDDESFLPGDLRRRVVAIEAEAAKRERYLIGAAVNALPRRIVSIGEPDGGWLHVRLAAVLDIIDADAEGSSDPVPDEPPGVATEMHGK